VVQHPVGADESLFPGFLAEEIVFDQECDRLSNELVEKLYSDFDGFVLFSTENDGLVADGVLTDGGEPMAHTPFGGKDVVLEAEALGIVGIARVTDVA
jgi:glycosyltransferase involved in cell wall biosynthesis